MQWYPLGEGAGDVALVLTVAGGEDLGRVRLGEQEVDDVQETLEVAVIPVIADGDEGDRDTGGNAAGVLDIEVLDSGPFVSTIDSGAYGSTYSLDTGLAARLGV